MMSTAPQILVINPGSTSTKIAVYEGGQEKFQENINHGKVLFKRYKTIAEQLSMRKDAIAMILERKRFDFRELTAIVARGGILPPVKAGAYRINEAMVERVINKPLVEHASNLGAAIAYEIAGEWGIPSFIYDSVAVDELEGVARISGLPEIERVSHSHALNSRAVAIKAAGDLGKSYYDLNFIVAHLGGGISLSVHQKGKMVDVISDDEGPFSPERAGRVPCRNLMELCYSGKYEKDLMKKMLRGSGGLLAYLGTNDARDVEDSIQKGDEKAELIYQAMAYQIAKGIGELATVLKGNVDKIIITGGIANSKMLTGWIKDRVMFIAPVEVIPGENELRALALGGLRVLTGEEEAHEYCEDSIVTEGNTI
ncbi:MAG: butyrate kinase [Dehalobacterium sp.]